MKKLLTVLLAALMLFTFAACDNDSTDDNDLDSYKKEDKVVTSVTNDKGETFHFENIDTETVSITAYEGDDRAHLLEIPETLNGKTVVSISKGAFKDCSKINAVTFPSTLTTIGDYAFSGCVLLEYVDIPETVTSIGIGAFNDCTELAAFEFLGTSQISVIKQFTFNNCVSLTAITIPASVKTIETGAFMDCTSLAVLTISEGVETIGGVAFRNCTALSTLNLPASLQTIEAYAFTNYDSLYLNGVTAPEGSVAETYVKEQMRLSEQIN